MSSKTQVVKTYSRIRPLSQSGEQKVFYRHNICTIKSQNHQQYSFDGVYDQQINNKQIYKETTHNVIQQCFQGYNACIMAYGQTFSGKTHTMKGNAQDPGIIPQCLSHIFYKIKSEQILAKVKIIYIEIYNENVIDLLNSQQDKILQVREDAKRNILFIGIKQIEIQNIEQGMEWFQIGQKKRKFASNNINNMSSRSHTIFRISFSIVKNDQKVTSQINLVDLAGSQSIQKTKGQKNLKSEGQNINKSLLALQKVIRSMSLKQSYTNFRDSKLTRILQKSLCENSNSSIICMINPTKTNYSESINTLKFGITAAKIKIETRQNLIKSQQIMNKTQMELLSQKYLEFPQRAQMQQLKNRISQLQKQNNYLSKQRQNFQKQNYLKQDRINELQKYQTQIQKQLQIRREEDQIINKKWSDRVDQLQRKLCFYEIQVQKLDKKILQLKDMNRILQKSQRYLIDRKHQTDEQLKAAKQVMQRMKSQFDQEVSNRSKKQSFSKEQHFRNILKPQIADIKKPNPFHLPQYVPPQQRNFQNLSPMKMSRIIQLKNEVVDISLKMRKLNLAYIDLEQKYQQVKGALQQKERQDQRQYSKRSSGKINPASSQYNQIRRLQNKIMKLKQQLKRSQLRQEKNRQISKNLNKKNLLEIQEFQQFLNMKNDPNFHVNQNIQAFESSRKNRIQQKQFQQVNSSLILTPNKKINNFNQQRNNILAQQKQQSDYSLAQNPSLNDNQNQMIFLNNPYKNKQGVENGSAKCILDKKNQNLIDNPQQSNAQMYQNPINSISNQKFINKNNQNQDFNISNGGNVDNNNFSYNSPTKNNRNRNFFCQNSINNTNGNAIYKKDESYEQNLLSSIKKPNIQKIEQNDQKLSFETGKQYQI